MRCFEPELGQRVKGFGRRALTYFYEPRQKKLELNSNTEKDYTKVDPSIIGRTPGFIKSKGFKIPILYVSHTAKMKWKEFWEDSNSFNMESLRMMNYFRNKRC
ncbi:hypothetical protein CEXT_132361 [Caerostris extrusa]|uniref:Uncharacterized protein n=1 Tax=Caerostris extrusa TaxID=172846 RepID=A0AAV4UAA5_CAEEX|nr:hypothetical protein CEXT_132361 [Caerostris extrusa]